MSQLGDALFTTTQRRLLALFFGQPERSFYFKELLRLTGMGVATIKRELERFHQAGIVSLQKVGNQHHYQADPACPIFPELKSIVRKTFGVSGTLREALDPLREHILKAFVFGSVASGKESSFSDIDVLIVGNVSFSDVVAALYGAGQELKREINPKVYGESEWAELVQHGDPFIRELLRKPRLDVIGDTDESGKSAGDSS